VRIAFISDLHGDVHALVDALRVIDNLGCVAIVCAGDFIDGGFGGDTVTGPTPWSMILKTGWSLRGCEPVG